MRLGSLSRFKLSMLSLPKMSFMLPFVSFNTFYEGENDIFGYTELTIDLRILLFRSIDLFNDGESSLLCEPLYESRDPAD